jgi:hypothetical protein
LLLLVDGRRNEAEVRRMAAAAGVPDHCFDELCGLGLIAVPAAPPAAVSAPVLAPVSSSPAMPAGTPARDADLPASTESFTQSDGNALPTIATTIEARAAVEPAAEPADMQVSAEQLPVADAVAAAIAAVPRLADADAGLDSIAGESLLPAARTLQPEAENSGWQAAVSLIRPSQTADFDDADPALDEARELLLRAVRAAAPVAGSLTSMRLRRARSRADLAALLGEVEARIVRPPRELSAQQTMRRARLLLDVPHDSVLPVLGT